MQNKLKAFAFLQRIEFPALWILQHHTCIHLYHSSSRFEVVEGTRFSLIKWLSFGVWRKLGCLSSVGAHQKVYTY